MHRRSNQAPELNQPDTGNASMIGANPPAKRPTQLDELLEQGEISPEAYAEYSATAEAALSSSWESSGYANNTAPTRFAEAEGIRFAYRRFGNPIGTP